MHTMGKPLASFFVICLVLTWATAAKADPVFFDPTGDTFGVGAVKPDITSVNGTVAGSTLTFRVTFAAAIAAPSASLPNSVIGFIDIDTDQSAATGAPSFQGIFGPPPAPLLGDEFFIVLETEAMHPGFVDLVNAATSASTLVAITYTATSFSVVVPLSALGGDDGIVNYGVIVGTFAEPTDEATNGTIPPRSGPAPVPEPATLILLASGLAGAVLRSRKVKE